MFFKNARCEFQRRCKLERECSGCVIPKKAKEYDELVEYKTMYSADIEASQGDYVRRRLGLGMVMEGTHGNYES